MGKAGGKKPHARRTKPGAVLIGADLGGTNFKCGVLGMSGEVLWRDSIPLLEPNDPRGIWSEIRSLIAEAFRRAEGRRVAAIGVGAAAPLDWKEGRIFSPPNMRGLKDARLAGMLEREFGTAAFIENDANAAAYGEFRLGAGRGTQSMVALTLGTGVGGGIIIDGRLHRGSNGVAAELGHTIVDPTGPPCGCGSRGCLETYASATATARRWREGVSSGRIRPPASLAKQPGEVTAKDLFEFAELGDGGSALIFAETGAWLGEAAGSFANVLDPDIFVFCGGMAAASKHFMPALLERFRGRAVSPAREKAEIATGRLGSDSGIIGAALLAAERLRPRR